MVGVLLGILVGVVTFVPFVLALLVPRTERPEWTADGLRWSIQHLSRPVVGAAAFVGLAVTSMLALFTGVAWTVTTESETLRAPAWVTLSGLLTIGATLLTPGVPLLARFCRSTLIVDTAGFGCAGPFRTRRWAWHEVGSVTARGRTLVVRDTTGVVARVRVAGAARADVSAAAERLRTCTRAPR